MYGSRCGDSPCRSFPLRGPLPFSGANAAWGYRHTAKYETQNIAILLIIKGIAIVNVRKFCYI